MPQSRPRATDLRSNHPLWDERDAFGRHAMLTEILAQVSHEALQGDTLEAVLRGIVECINRRLPVTIASIILLDEEGTHFVQEVWAGPLDLELPCGLPWPVGLGAAGRCIRTGQSQLIDDVHADPDYIPGNAKVNSEYLVPIRHRDRVHGVLNLESVRADFFTPDVCAVFDAIAEQIAGAIHVARLLLELETANRKLRVLSMQDGLTGIANRRCFDERIAEEWDRHGRADLSLALLMVDVDWFKALNDAHGHLRGDECLRALAQLCSAGVRGDSDLVARYGGEEIVVLLPGCGADAAVAIAEQLRRAVEALAIPHPASPAAGCVTVSIGVSAIRPRLACASIDALLSAADAAMYAAKARGRNCVVAMEAAPA